MPEAKKGMRLYVILICVIHMLALYMAKNPDILIRCPLKLFLRFSCSNLVWLASFLAQTLYFTLGGITFVRVSGLCCNNIDYSILRDFQALFTFFQGFFKCPWNRHEFFQGFFKCPFFKGFSSALDYSTLFKSSRTCTISEYCVIL